MKAVSDINILVTGGSGFLGSSCIIAFLTADYQVRGSNLSLSKKSTTKEALKNGGVTDFWFKRLSFVGVDLDHDKCWDKALESCTPIPTEEYRHENLLIIPARDGTLCVFRAAARAGVKRVVLTSSFNAIAYGHPDQSAPFTEVPWSNEKSKLSAYPKSKVVAERAA
ncbi:hypothetical protein BGW36DRAFT_383845 [Talaromyces proteolyticus]|uniref:3-beta hydroxysteroid dehydrogenase/isomerase domain-containing protein n=1 Tax=Talaromyces proteolyticus TaxID=1131652 RepID=A0AAD4KKZ1_9EURO|nr:uncharacterized protein BGW36DRAFT_383845 [Talaromyces proteolyticus]KAH8693838.1 hypothetical protein BGW36DRAFT_383845 [Talaromyces proteolyticus]